MDENVNQGNVDPNDDKVIGILSYLGILWIVAYILYGNKKSTYNHFHVKEGLGLLITWVALYIFGFIIGFVPIINFIIGFLMIFVYIGVFVLIVLGVINAANGENKPLPVIGKFTDSILKNFK